MNVKKNASWKIKSLSLSHLKPTWVAGRGAAWLRIYLCCLQCVLFLQGSRLMNHELLVCCQRCCNQTPGAYWSGDFKNRILAPQHRNHIWLIILLCFFLMKDLYDSSSKLGTRVYSAKRCPGLLLEFFPLKCVWVLSIHSVTVFWVLVKIHYPVRRPLGIMEIYW